MVNLGVLRLGPLPLFVTLFLAFWLERTRYKMAMFTLLCAFVAATTTVVTSLPRMPQSRLASIAQMRGESATIVREQK